MATKKEKIKLNKYLSTHSRNRNLDNAIINWCRKKGIDTVKKTISEWDEVIKSFLSETEK